MDVGERPLPAAGATAARRRRCSGRGRRATACANSATTAAATNGRSIEDTDLEIAAEIKEWQASDAQLAALLAERKARSRAERPAAA